MQIEVHDPAAEELKKDVQFIKDGFLLLALTGGKPIATIKHIAKMEGCSESQLRAGGRERYLLPRFGESGYPTGTLLNDIFSIRLISLYPYVSCGYTGNVDTLIDKPLSDVTSEDMTLIRLNRAEDGVFDLYTSVLPDESVRTLRVRLSTDEGYEFEYTFNLGAGE